MRYPISILLGFIMLTRMADAQEFEKLDALKDHAYKIHFSHGHQQRAETIASQVDRAFKYYQQLLETTPDFTLLVLSGEDWSKYTSQPVVYGMPHYDGQKKLVVAAEENPFWQSFIPPLEKLPAALGEKIRSTYKNEDGSLSMRPFFDLLALHELGHAFHFQGNVNMQRKWMGELFVNILLHTYITENEPHLIPALTVFPQMVVSAGSREYLYTSLEDIEARYEEIGSKYPKNYGWYQCRWHTAAAKIYDSAGKNVGRKLWDALKNLKADLNDKEFADYLEKNVDKSIADMIRTWE